MNLIPLTNRTIGNQAIQTCNARELHVFLESKQDFTTWIKTRINQYGFVENVDYLLHKFVEQVPHQGGIRQNTKTDYFITLNMAKELAMVERTAKGREARLYFIECEHRYMATLKDRSQNQNITMKRLLDNIERALNMQSSQNHRLINLQKQCLDLQQQTLTNQNHLQTLMEKVIDNNTKRRYRQATQDDIQPVLNGVTAGHTYQQIADALGISPYFVARIKLGRYTVNPDGTLKAADHTTKYS